MDVEKLCRNVVSGCASWCSQSDSVPLPSHPMKYVNLLPLLPDQHPLRVHILNRILDSIVYRGWSHKKQFTFVVNNLLPYCMELDVFSILFDSEYITEHASCFHLEDENSKAKNYHCQLWDALREGKAIDFLTVLPTFASKLACGLEKFADSIRRRREEKTVLHIQTGHGRFKLEDLPERVGIPFLEMVLQEVEKLLEKKFKDAVRVTYELLCICRDHQNVLLLPNENSAAPWIRLLESIMHRSAVRETFHCIEVTLLLSPPIIDSILPLIFESIFVKLSGDSMTFVDARVAVWEGIVSRFANLRELDILVEHVFKYIRNIPMERRSVSVIGDLAAQRTLRKHFHQIPSGQVVPLIHSVINGAVETAPVSFVFISCACSSLSISEDAEEEVSDICNKCVKQFLDSDIQGVHLLDAIQSLELCVVEGDSDLSNSVLKSCSSPQSRARWALFVLQEQSRRVFSGAKLDLNLCRQMSLELVSFFTDPSWSGEENLRFALLMFLEAFMESSAVSQCDLPVLVCGCLFRSTPPSNVLFAKNCEKCRVRKFKEENAVRLDSSYMEDIVPEILLHVGDIVFPGLKNIYGGIMESNSESDMVRESLEIISMKKRNRKLSLDKIRMNKEKMCVMLTFLSECETKSSKWGVVASICLSSVMLGICGEKFSSKRRPCDIRLWNEVMKFISHFLEEALLSLKIDSLASVMCSLSNVLVMTLKGIDECDECVASVGGVAHAIGLIWKKFYHSRDGYSVSSDLLNILLSWTSPVVSSALLSSFDDVGRGILSHKVQGGKGLKDFISTRLRESLEVVSKGSQENSVPHWNLISSLVRTRALSTHMWPDVLEMCQSMLTAGGTSLPTEATTALLNCLTCFTASSAVWAQYSESEDAIRRMFTWVASLCYRLSQSIESSEHSPLDSISSELSRATLDAGCWDQLVSWVLHSLAEYSSRVAGTTELPLAILGMRSAVKNVDKNDQTLQSLLHRYSISLNENERKLAKNALVCLKVHPLFPDEEVSPRNDLSVSSLGSVSLSFRSGVFPSDGVRVVETIVRKGTPWKAVFILPSILEGGCKCQSLEERRKFMRAAYDLWNICEHSHVQEAFSMLESDTQDSFRRWYESYKKEEKFVGKM